MSDFNIVNKVARVCARPLRPGRGSTRGPVGFLSSVPLAVSLLLILLSVNTFAADQEAFKTLRIGDQTYQNVKVTTKGKSFIIIQHSGGITSIKVSDLPAEALEKLGYAPKPSPKKRLRPTAMLASIALPKTETVIKPVQAKVSETWHRIAETSNKFVAKPTRTQWTVAAVVFLLVYGFGSYCCLLICEKIGFEPGVWIWLPFVQALPMLRAACMSPWWFFALLVPGVNLVAYVIWSFKIVAARQKTWPLAILLLIPVANWFAFIFLAFSNAPAPKKETLPGLMTPQRA